MIKRGMRYCALICMTWLAVACDNQGRPIEEFGLNKLEKGISTEGDVVAVMGQPESVLQTEDGLRALQYPKGPAGARTWMFVIDKSGKLLDYKQLLTEENFALIKPGMDKSEVRRRLGKPRTVQQFRLKNEEVWDWRYLAGQSERFFNVHFDMDSGKVTGTSTSEEMSG